MLYHDQFINKEGSATLFLEKFFNAVDGFDVLDSLESFGSITGKTKKPCVIVDCGQLQVQ